MILESRNFLPESAGEWVTLIAPFAVLAFSIYGAHNSLREKLNRVGARVNDVKERVDRMEPSVDRNMNELQASMADRRDLHAKAATNSAEAESVKDQVMEMKIDLIGHMNELKQLINTDSSKMLQRIVRLETISRIERKLGRQLTDDEEGI